MGLLDRAIALSSKEQAVETRVSSIPDTHPSYPRDIIDAFRELSGFTWGSIMLLDSEGGEYHPLVSTGFNASNELSIKSNLVTLHLDEADRITTAKFETLLPNLGGFDPAGEVMILRIGTGNPPPAILVAGDWPDDHPIRTKTRQLVDRFQHEIGSYVSKKEGETAFSKRLTDAGIDKAMAVFLDISDAIEAISEPYFELDTEKAAREVRNLLERITGRMGRLYSLEGERVLIIFPGERLPNHELYLHQLSASFGLMYKKLNRTLDFRAEFKLWPNDRTYIEKQLPSW